MTDSIHPLYVSHTPGGDVTLIAGTYTSEQLDQVRDAVAAHVVSNLPPIKFLGQRYLRENRYWFDWHSKARDEERLPPAPYRCLPHV